MDIHQFSSSGTLLDLDSVLCPPPPPPLQKNQKFIFFVNLCEKSVVGAGSSQKKSGYRFGRILYLALHYRPKFFGFGF
jgi:hypothetical protein